MTTSVNIKYIAILFFADTVFSKKIALQAIQIIAESIRRWTTFCCLKDVCNQELPKTE